MSTSTMRRKGLRRKGPKLKAPPTLRRLRQWVPWRYEERDGDQRKVPLGSTTDPSTWLTFDDALELSRSEGLDGIGFVFTVEDAFSGVDLDGCRDPKTEKIEEWATTILKLLGSYAEVSPSGTGVKVWVEGKKPPGSRSKWYPFPDDRTRAIEVYDQRRYFTFTGQVLDGFGQIRRRAKALMKLCALAPSPTDITSDDLADLPNTRSDRDDGQILRELPGPIYHRFFVASRLTSDPDESSSDFQLACELAKILGNDPLRIERLMRESTHGRDKWDRRGDDYLGRTIRAAIAHTCRAGGRADPALPPLQLVPVTEVQSEVRARELLPRLGWAGYVTVFAGREKDGKTTYAAWAVVQAAAAHYDIVWLSTDESPSMIGARFRAMVQEYGEEGDEPLRQQLLGRIRVLSRDPRSWSELEALWKTEWRPKIFVIDTLSSFLMAVDGKVPQTSEGEAWQAKVLQFKRWLDDNRSAAIVLLAHASKETGDYRGSSGIGAAPDAIVTYRRASAPNLRALVRQGRFGIGNDRVVVEYGGDVTPGFVDVEERKMKGSPQRPYGRSTNAEPLLELLRAAGPAGLTEAEWRRQVGEAGINAKSSFNRARDLLKESDCIDQDGGRWYVVAR